jgi:hypothetical protein
MATVIARPTAGVGPVPAQRDPADAQQDGQRGEAVGAGMEPVSDQGGRADLPADPDPVAGDQLVAREADHGGDSHRGQITHRVRMREPGHSRVGGQRGRRGNDQDDDHAGQVLGPAIPVGVAAGRRPPADDERDRQRHRGQRVGGVVQRVAQQRHRPGERNHDRLQHRGRREHRQGDPQRAQAFRAGLHRRIDLVRCVM